MFTIITGIITNIITWFVSKKKTRLEERIKAAAAEHDEFKNVRELLQFWKENCTDLLSKIEILTAENEQLRKEVAASRKEIEHLRIDLQQFTLTFSTAQ